MDAVETMMYANEVPWHGKGKKAEGEAVRNWRECCELAGMGWLVRQEPVYLADGRRLRTVANIRSTDGRVVGEVGPDFEVLQNSEVFEWFAPWLESGEATIEAAGSLFDGSRIWCLAKITGAEGLITGDDAVVRYALLSHAHDGSLAARLGFTDTRVVCNNTLRAAFNSKASQLVRVRHTANIRRNLELVRETMDLARGAFYATLEQFKKLRDKGVNQRDVRRYVQLVIAPETKPEDLATVTRRRIDHIVDLAFRGIGNHGETMWDAFNGVTQYTTWERGRSQDNRVASSWYGDSAKLNERALEVAIDFEPERRELVVVR